MTGPDAWTELGTHAPDELCDATLQLHWAAQYLASMGQTFAEAADDDSHRAMTWNGSLRAFVSAPMAGPYPFRAALRPSDMTLLLVDRTGAELGSLPLAGVARDEGYEWLGLGMATYLGGTPPKIARPDYELPPHPVSTGDARFDVDSSHLRTLSALYAAAAEVLDEVTTARTDASSVLCWPHHFDIATLLTVDDGTEDGVTKTVGVGMAPMGGGFESWYWYVTPYPYPAADALPSLSPPGYWHTEGWTGAVLRGTEVAPLSANERKETVLDFVTRAIDGATAALSG